MSNTVLIKTKQELLIAWSSDKAALLYASDALRADRDVIQKGALIGAHLSMVHESVKDDVKLWISVCQLRGMYYVCAGRRAQADVDVAVSAIDGGLDHKYLSAKVRWEPKVLEALCERMISGYAGHDGDLAQMHPSLRRWIVKNQVPITRMEGIDRLIAYGYERKALVEARTIALRAFSKSKALKGIPLHHESKTMGEKAPSVGAGQVVRAKVRL